MNKSSTARGRDDQYGSEEGVDAVRERVMSPDNKLRSKSPPGDQQNDMGARAASPQGGEQYGYTQNGSAVINNQQQSMNAASIAMARNAMGARSPSPIVERAKTMGDGMFTAARSGSPVINGRHSPGPVRPGSTGNITADLIRDLKVKEAEVEELKKRDAWMKAALTTATNAGFVYASTEPHALENERRSPGSEDTDVKSLVSMIMRLKQDQGRLQVRHFKCL